MNEGGKKPENEYSCMLMEEVEDSHAQKDVSRSRLGRIKSVKTSMRPKASYRFSAILIKMSTAFYKEFEKGS